VIFSDFYVCDESNSFLLKNIHTSGYHIIGQLHFWNSVRQQAAYTVAFFKYRHHMPRFVQLGCSGKSGRPRTDYGYFFAGTCFGWLRHDPPLRKSTLNDRPFYCTNRYWRFIDAEYTSSFTRCRTSRSCKLREVVFQVFTVQGFFPLATINKIIPFWDEMVYRATGGYIIQFHSGMACRHSTVHTARTLFCHFFIRQRDCVIIPVLCP